MGLSSRVTHELHCDSPQCSSRISGPTPGDVMRHAMEVEGWRQVFMTGGHGRGEIIYVCRLHTENR